MCTYRVTKMPTFGDWGFRGLTVMAFLAGVSAFLYIISEDFRWFVTNKKSKQMLSGTNIAHGNCRYFEDCPSHQFCVYAHEESKKHYHRYCAACSEIARFTEDGEHNADDVAACDEEKAKHAPHTCIYENNCKFGEFCLHDIDCVSENCTKTDGCGMAPLVCVCTNGTPDTYPDCATNGATECSECDAGYHLTGTAGTQSCLANVCVCANGTPDAHPDCAANGATECSACDAEYTLAGTAGAKTCT